MPERVEIDLGEDEVESVSCSSCTTTSPEHDSYMSAFVAVACVAGMTIYTSPLFDDDAPKYFGYSDGWGGWYLLTNLASLSQLFFVVPGVFADM